MDLHTKDVRIRSSNDNNGILLFEGKYDGRRRGVEDNLKLALRMSDPVQFVVEGRCIVKATYVPCPS